MNRRIFLSIINSNIHLGLYEKFQLKNVGKKSLFSRARRLCTAALVIISCASGRWQALRDATSRWPRAWSAYARPRYAICANVLIAALSGEHGSGRSGRESRVRLRTYISRATTYVTRACPTRAGARTAYIRVIACRPWRLLAPRNCDAMRFPRARLRSWSIRQARLSLTGSVFLSLHIIINTSFPF